MKKICIIVATLFISMSHTHENPPTVKFEETLMLFDSDIKQAGFIDWFKAHGSSSKPLHRYCGTLALTDSEIMFMGKDQKENKDYTLKIPRDHIKEIKLGFDSTFRKIDDRQLGLKNFEPLRVIYQELGNVKTVYIFANYHNEGVWRTSNNKTLLDKLINK